MFFHTTSINLTDVDFGNFLTSSISGRKFEDLDLDGLQGPGEPGLAGWVIFLDENTNNALDPGEVSTVTDAQGDYLFKGLTLETLHVAEVNQAGWVQTAPATGFHIVNLTSGGLTVTGQDFGNFQELIVGPEFLVNQTTDDSQLFPSIAMAPDGRFVLAWASRSAASDFDIFARQYNADGSPAGSEFRVNTFLPGTQTLPSVAIDNNGDFVVTWTSLNQDGTPRSVYAQRFDSTGTPVSTEFRVNMFAFGFQTNATVGMTGDGEFTIVWTDFSLLSTASDLFAQQFDALGVRQGDPFKVNAFTNVGQGADTDLAMDPDGNFTIVWTSFTQDGSGGGVFTRMFSADGTPHGDEFQVNTFATGQQTEPAIAMDSGGNLTVVWASRDQDGSGQGVFARQFNAMGTPLGNEISVNAFTAGDQRDPEVSMDASGGFVVTWNSNLQDGDRDGVFGQRYDAAGNQLSGPLGVEFLVNTTTLNDQNDPVIASDTAGNFVIAWASYGQDGDAQGIVARQFQLVSPGGAEITVITSNATKIVDDTTLPILFAETMEASPGPMATFVVRNDGIDSLSLGSVGLPTGFLLIDGLPASLAPGASDSLTIQLDTSLPGSYGGQVVIVNNDGNENPFNFAIAGSVMAEPVVEVVGATPGLFAPSSSTFFLKNDMQPGVADEVFTFGTAGAGWIPLAGDWNSDQIDTTGVFDLTSSTFYLNDSNATAEATSGIRFGPFGSGWTPIVGDWNGDGVDSIGLYKPSSSTFFLKNDNSPGAADTFFRFGPRDAGWIPVVGDWDGDGTDTIGLYRPSDSSFFLKNSNSSGAGDLVFRFGPRGVDWTPLVGDWDGDGDDTVGLHVPATSTFYFKNDNSAGMPDHSIRFGPTGSGWTPLVGDWDGSAATAQTATAAMVSNTFALLGETLTSDVESSTPDDTIESAVTSTLTSSSLSLTSSQTIVGADTQLSSGADDSVDAALADLDLDPLNDDLLEELAAAYADGDAG